MPRNLVTLTHVTDASRLSFGITRFETSTTESCLWPMQTFSHSRRFVWTSRAGATPCRADAAGLHGPLPRAASKPEHRGQAAAGRGWAQLVRPREAEHLQVGSLGALAAVRFGCKVLFRCHSFGEHCMFSLVPHRGRGENTQATLAVLAARRFC